jgi:hypothetical protein
MRLTPALGDTISSEDITRTSDTTDYSVQADHVSSELVNEKPTAGQLDSVNDVKMKQIESLAFKVSHSFILKGKARHI